MELLEPIVPCDWKTLAGCGCHLTRKWTANRPAALPPPTSASGSDKSVVRGLHSPVRTTPTSALREWHWSRRRPAMRLQVVEFGDVRPAPYAMSLNEASRKFLCVRYLAVPRLPSERRRRSMNRSER